MSLFQKGKKTKKKKSTQEIREVFISSTSVPERNILIIAYLSTTIFDLSFSGIVLFLVLSTRCSCYYEGVHIMSNRGINKPLRIAKRIAYIYWLRQCKKYNTEEKELNMQNAS
jgi:hypothetical protein